jgi:hypothetical protein
MTAEDDALGTAVPGPRHRGVEQRPAEPASTRRRRGRQEEDDRCRVTSRHGHGARAVAGADDDAVAGVPAAREQLVGGEVLVGKRKGREAGEVAGPLAAPEVERRDQNSVSALSFSWISLYSGFEVSGRRLIIFAMFPATFTRPCMNAALASSSPFMIFTASS